MRKILLSTVLLIPLTVAAQNNDEYLSDWWHQSLGVIGRYHTRFGPRLGNDIYPEYVGYGRKDWFDFYGYVDIPKFFGAGNGYDRGAWDDGSPLFLEIEPRFSIDNLSGLSLGFGPFKEWYFANDYIYDMGDNRANRQSTWYMGLGTDIETYGLPLKVSADIYAKYQWQNYGAANENEWDGYRFKIKYSLPITKIWGGQFSYSGFTNFDFGSELGDRDEHHSNDSIASSHIFSLAFTHWRYAVTARYFHNGGQWQDGTRLGPKGQDYEVYATGWGGYFNVGYAF